MTRHGVSSVGITKRKIELNEEALHVILTGYPSAFWKMELRTYY